MPQSCLSTQLPMSIRPMTGLSITRIGWFVVELSTLWQFRLGLGLGLDLVLGLGLGLGLWVRCRGLGLGVRVRVSGSRWSRTKNLKVFIRVVTSTVTVGSRAHTQNISACSAERVSNAVQDQCQMQCRTSVKCSAGPVSRRVLARVSVSGPKRIALNENKVLNENRGT